MSTQLDPAAATPGTAGTARPSEQATGAGRRQGFDWAPYAFVAPYLVLFGLFVLVPAVYGLWISLHDWDFLLPVKPFVGLANYTELFERGSGFASTFWRGIWATAQFTIYSVPLLMVLPLGVALVLSQRFPGRTFFRAVYFAPYVLGVAVVGLLWRYILDPTSGVLNYILGQAAIPWLTSLPWAWISLVAMTVWWTLGFNTVIYLAGLQEIGRDLYEAASVDGANRWQQFRSVTIPGLRRVIVFVATTTVLASANMFGQSFLTTQGAPGNATRTAIMTIAEEGFRANRIGSAAAMSYLLSVFLIGVSVVLLLLFRRLED
jgi:multiple sugar transport system permease protein